MRPKDRLEQLEGFYLDDDRWPSIDRAAEREQGRSHRRVFAGTATLDDYQRVWPSLPRRVIDELHKHAADLRLERLGIPLERIWPRAPDRLREVPEFVAAAQICSHFPDETPPPHHHALLQASLRHPHSTVRALTRLCVLVMGEPNGYPRRTHLEQWFAWEYLSRLGKIGHGGAYNTPTGRLAGYYQAGCNRSFLEVECNLLPDTCYQKSSAQHCNCQCHPNLFTKSLATTDNSPQHHLATLCYLEVARLLSQRADLIHNGDPDTIVIIETADEFRDRVWQALAHIIDVWEPDHALHAAELHD